MKTERIYTDVLIDPSNHGKDEQNGPEPDGAAMLIYKVALKRIPKPIKVHRFVYKLIVLLMRILPLRLSNYIVGKLYA